MTNQGNIAQRRCAPKRLGRVLVLGLGKSGKASVEYCLPLLGNRVESLSIAAGERNEASEAFAAFASARGAQVAFGDDGVATLAESVVADTSEPPFDLCIPSPGIPPFSPLYTAALAQSREVVSEVEFAWRESDKNSRWVAVTGTNGKTTTAACSAHLLQAAGFAAAAVGNIGQTCISAVAAGQTDVYVAEISSYQLASTHEFAPNVAVLLGITPDHLHWHTTFEAYCDAKYKIFDHLSSVPGGVAVLDATNDVVRTKLRSLRALGDKNRGFDLIPLGTKDGLEGDMRQACGNPNAAFLAADATLHVAFEGSEHVLAQAEDLQIKGKHNIANALTSAAVALAAGASPDAITQGLRSFTPLEHRIEPCGEVHGVCCFNDSKATNVDATLQALTAFPQTPLVVLLGGDDKGTDLSALVASARKHARAVVCYGEAGPRFLEAFSATSDDDNLVVLSAKHMVDAFDAALDVAQKGDILLLSPACASFDEFTSFEERGHVFKSLVAEHTDCEV